MQGSLHTLWASLFFPQAPAIPGASLQAPGALKSKPDILVILVLVVTLIFDTQRLDGLLWRTNIMIRIATHLKGAVWGSQGTQEGKSRHRLHQTPLLKRGSRPFFCSFASSTRPVGCRSPGGWSALCEEAPIPPRAQEGHNCAPSRPTLTVTGSGGTCAGHQQHPLHRPSCFYLTTSQVLSLGKIIISLGPHSLPVRPAGQELLIITFCK